LVAADAETTVLSTIPMIRAIFVLVNTVVSPLASFAATQEETVNLVNYSRFFAVAAPPKITFS
jgi:hypothetical protein